jgi:hypothetical protein
MPAPTLENQYRILYTNGVKTTLDINDQLLVRAKAQSARERRSLTALIEEGLKLRLRTAVQPRRTHPIKLAIYRGRGGVAKGVDPTSNRSLCDVADDGT